MATSTKTQVRSSLTMTKSGKHVHSTLKQLNKLKRRGAEIIRTGINFCNYQRGYMLSKTAWSRVPEIDGKIVKDLRQWTKRDLETRNGANEL